MADRMTGRPLHLDISDLPMKKGGDLEPQQVCPRSERKRQVVLHEPPRAPVLRAEQPHRADRHGQLVPRAVRADTPQDQGRGRIYYTYTEEKPISFNPFFTDDYKFSVEKKDSIKTLAAGAVEGRGREKSRRRRAASWAVRCRRTSAGYSRTGTSSPRSTPSTSTC